jgi:hypothetical protein
MIATAVRNGIDVATATAGLQRNGRRFAITKAPATAEQRRL